MAIPRDKLDCWSKPGKNEVSKDTYAKMRKIIEDNIANTEIYLQGSYSNSTNIRDNSDIDIIVILNDWTHNSYGTSVVRNSRDALYNAINGKNNFQFTKGNKCVKYKGNTNYVPADLVPCIKYSADRHEGIMIYDHGTGRQIINYPKQHLKNGEAKSGSTDGNFKKAVRMFKNARNYAVEKGLLIEGSCPSYYLECLLYNVPDKYFFGNESDIFYNVLSFLNNNKSNLSGFSAQNGIHPLFGYDSCWSISHAQTSIDKIVLVWNNWGKF